MLAQFFLPPAQLELTDAQHAALVTVLGMLERGELTHVKLPETPYSCPNLTEVKPGQFNMGAWRRTHEECGTLCCIGGTAEIVGLVRFQADEGTPLHDLFYADSRPKDTWLSTITTDQAARALRNYLTLGSANWAEVLVA